VQYNIFKKVPDLQLLLYFSFYSVLTGGIFKARKLLYVSSRLWIRHFISALKMTLVTTVSTLLKNKAQS